MALLQIAEPGQGDAPPARLAGIDLGTTHSLIAVAGADKSPKVLCLHDSPLLPSAVAYTERGVLVGTEALAAAEQPDVALFTSTKRAIGLTAAELADEQLPFLPVGEGREPVRLRARMAGAGGPEVAPEQIAAEILEKLAARAAEELGGALDGAVITVPAWFDENRRQATAQAASLAGIPVLRLISEPTAAALAYGLDRAATGKVLVYDFGGGTFDCSLLVLTEGLFEVRATAGDTRLGGDDLDRLLAEQALAGWQLARDDLPPEELRHLLRACRSAREALTDNENASLSLSLLGAPRQRSVRRAELAQLCAPAIDRTLALCRRALRDAEVELQDIDALVLVGGTTRMPAVRDKIAAFFGRAPQTDLDPDQVVVQGALRHANTLAGVSTGALLVDVTPLSLGIETLGGLVETVIARNSPVPAVQAREFTTARDGQTAMSLHVVQGERELAEECRSLARFRLAGIPPMAAGAGRVRLTFQLDESGLLAVTAREQSTGTEARVQTERAGLFAEGEIKRLLTEAEAASGSDDKERRRRQAVVAAETLLDSLRGALREDGDSLLEAGERRQLQTAMDSLGQFLTDAEAGAAAIEAASEALGERAAGFAQRRMDNSIQSALKGVAVDSLAEGQ